MSQLSVLNLETTHLQTSASGKSSSELWGADNTSLLASWQSHSGAFNVTDASILGLRRSGCASASLAHQFEGALSAMDASIAANLEPRNFVASGEPHSLWVSQGTPITITYSYSNLLNGELRLGTPVLRSAIEEALRLWARYVPLNFVEVVDSGPLPNSPHFDYPAPGHAHIRIGHHAMDADLAHAFIPPRNGYLNGLDGDIHFDVDANWSVVPPQGFDFLQIAVHEIGHAIGLDHESMNPAIMNAPYTSRYAGLGTSFLFPDDIDAIQSIYGAGIGSVAPLLGTATIQRWATGQGGFWDRQQWLAGDFNGDGRDDLAKAFNDNGLASIDVHPSTGSSFAIQRWATGQGGFWDTQQWLVGDFNGDGRDDLAKAFNDNGLASIDVHLSTGSSFTIQRWATGQGGFWDTQQWLVGDFNGDGRDDLAKAFNDNGLASIDVHLSTGSGFTIQRWATGQGGFWNTQQWLAGDFNGDGRDDIAKAFDDYGLTSIDVHPSTGSSFAIQRWATGQGAFWNTQRWLAGDFNGDGRDDIAKAFNESGLATIDVHPSSGFSFAIQRWATGQGRFWNTQQWLAGDFNGDGRNDLAKAFNEYGLASIDVHRAG
ncbi:matrixin family metalloprotease (plasmid) [Kovacikia minuta CCNUW1]|uniref:matrixin family metalloprotease n=1 Tax=Kovacikia minuta TaxID=2931930 RepID=UPI001CCCB77A|nr:matrixin family metalloprotease [Kovacikia minuta]UBF30433.1 matrixin family metalloprotease [Kovacikia minuta CCNUW1]